MPDTRRAPPIPGSSVTASGGATTLEGIRQLEGKITVRATIQFAPLFTGATRQTGSSPRRVTRWMTRCWEPKSPTTECWVDRLSQKPTSPALQW